MDSAPRMVNMRNTLGNNLLLRARSDEGVAFGVVVVSWSGTGFRFAIPLAASLRLTGGSMFIYQRTVEAQGSEHKKCRSRLRLR